MASIAHVDNHLDPAEKKTLKACLAEQFSLKGKELTLLFEVVEEQGRTDFDFHELVSEINQLTLADASVNVDMIVQNVSERDRTDISFTVPLEDLEVATATCEGLADDLAFSGVMADPDLGRVSVVGAGMASNPGVAATMFETLAENDVNIEMIATSPIRISCVIAEEDVDRATVALHTAYGLD